MSKPTGPDPHDAPELNQWLAFQGRSLIVTDREHPGAQALLKPRPLSPSTAAAMHDGCHARWAVERSLPRSADPFGAAEKGTAVHAVLEEALALPAEQRTAQTLHDLLARIETVRDDVVAPDDPMKVTSWRGEVAAKMEKVSDAIDLRALDVIGTEVPLENLTIAKVPLRGYIDVYAREPNKIDTRILDWKTGNPRTPYKGDRDAYADQQRIYGMAIAALTGKLPVGATLIYTAIGVAKEVDYSREAMRDTVEAFKRSYDIARNNSDTGVFAMKASGLCGWCPLALVCPTGNAKRTVSAKTTSALIGPSLVIPTVLPGVRRTVPVAAEQGSQSMNGATVVTEAKSWEEVLPAGQTVPGTGSTLNPNSYAAIAAMTSTTMALDALHAYDVQNGTALAGNVSAIRSLGLTFASLFATVQTNLGLRASMQDGSNTRLRAAMHSVLAIQPPPLHSADKSDWEAWSALAVRRLEVLFKVSAEIWEAGIVAEPYADLAGTIAANRVSV
ncbi:PD-(D/E)XK nuclease family protein [Branchiibius sp. NY16-3462-2]|uniref:RecB family exonuclease n=1 Tax=Branchiibius sp. NY16-3462-2 TaxID=1807500 RepID=UPI0007979B59|nr:PD-(D/E)XK nuclease family protein [Branchiibius sp. NY16-3462-2]KYH43888.1 hypothetical protein AZH51_15760 [Branchiibius sp. NY16-3462-2]